jgi:hypothetical protein
MDDTGEVRAKRASIVKPMPKPALTKLLMLSRPFWSIQFLA